MNELLQTALKVQTFLDKSNISFCFIGGLAVQRWGRIRITKDVDLTLFAGFGEEEKYIKILSSKFSPRNQDYFNFAIQNRILLLKDENSVGIDISLAAVEYERDLINRSSLFQYSEHYNLRTCSADDLIILKAYANRDQDWFDIKNIILRNKKNLNLALIFDILNQLSDLKGEPEIPIKLNKYLKEN